MRESGFDVWEAKPYDLLEVEDTVYKVCDGDEDIVENTWGASTLASSRVTCNQPSRRNVWMRRLLGPPLRRRMVMALQIVMNVTTVSYRRGAI